MAEERPRIDYANGAFYVGPVEDQKRHGQVGTLTYANGEAKFVGKFDKNEMVEGKMEYFKQ